MAWAGDRTVRTEGTPTARLSALGRLDNLRAPIVCFTMKEDAMQMNTAIDVAIDRENPPPVARIETAAEQVGRPPPTLTARRSSCMCAFGLMRRF